MWDDITETVVVAIALLFVAIAVTLPWIVAAHFILKYW